MNPALFIPGMLALNQSFKNKTKPMFENGDYVCYVDLNSYQNGRVKIETDAGVHVVYSCNNDWDNFENYTPQLSGREQLQFGWFDAQGNEIATPDDLPYNEEAERDMMFPNREDDLE
jgi:hypothetical protein